MFTPIPGFERRAHDLWNINPVLATNNGRESDKTKGLYLYTFTYTYGTFLVYIDVKRTYRTKLPFFPQP